MAKPSTRPPEEYRLRGARCPWCGEGHDAASKVSGSPGGPKRGSVSLCIKCGAIAIFTRRHELRRATKAELAELANDPMVQAAMVAWKLTKMERHGDREQ